MTAWRPILVVDDDDALRPLLAAQFRSGGGMAVQEARTIEEARQLLNAPDARFDAILLDVTLPDGDGRDFCAELRKTGHRMPIIMLTGSDDEHDIVRGLDAGANDYVVKPFRMGELQARLRAQLRLFENSEDVVFEIGPYEFRPAKKQLLDRTNGQRIHLTEKETAILKFLYRAEGAPVARQVLLNEVWGYNSAVTTHTLETHVYRLRQKIERDLEGAKLLVTSGGGYCLALPRERQS
ncbi:response regulator transcription factor [Oecophyllibacter saccharovorans]|uniref:Response regulator transcription factor n=1 Tax=Oecophyllibacter saccharovorans TaxID=2558360 RepID=A0A506UQA7_9PROT|nr:response regulator transcription factor [Oecophyllibacter saccharovorans]QDH15764.1 response regulator transcription factor [Oecophyllibacter saccharovorans]TPW35545.1 response regulator transcription factor [Oecophyllibacter saccharovorans]